VTQAEFFPSSTGAFSGSQIDTMPGGRPPGGSGEPRLRPSAPASVFRRSSVHWFTAAMTTPADSRWLRLLLSKPALLAALEALKGEPGDPPLRTRSTSLAACWDALGGASASGPLAADDCAEVTRAALPLLLPLRHPRRRWPAGPSRAPLTNLAAPGRSTSAVTRAPARRL
jgi:hypothetical protein